MPSTDLDRAGNAFFRLAEHLKFIREILREAAKIQSRKRKFASGPGAMVQQMRRHYDTLVFMLDDAQKKWKRVEFRVSELVGKLHIESPQDSVTWCQQILITGGRLASGMQAQFSIHKDDANAAVKGLIQYANLLESFDDLTAMNNKVTKEIRAATVGSEQPPKESDSKPKAKSRQLQDKPVTVWVRKNLHKYSSRAEAIRTYIEIHGGTFKKLEQDVKNDLKKLSLLKSPPKRKKQS